jgi:transcriptional regulator GlxA family with amidase domain
LRARNQDKSQAPPDSIQERAVHVLGTSHASVDQIAAKVGYAEGVTLRALLRRRLGRGVHEIRRCR